MQRHRALHDALAVGALAHDDRAVVVLQRAAGDLARGGRVAVDQHHHGHHRVYRLRRGAELLRHPFQLSAVGHHHPVARDEDVDQLHGLVLQSAAIVAQVEHQSLDALLAHVDDVVADVARAVLREFVERHVANAVLHAGVVDCRHLYGPPCDLELHRLACGGPLHFQHE